MTQRTPPTIASVHDALAAGTATSETLVAACLARARDPEGEGARVFTRIYDHAIDAARESDKRRRAGSVLPLEGIPISIKDLFDVAGEPTTAGSVVLRDAPPALRDAPVVARLRAAGAVLVGRTNMTEFAYSAVGINPHFGTPRNPWDRATGRIPGGSSSGAAVSVTDEMAVVAIGSDTGGSVRIPAAFCGLTGFKPTARRVSREGAFPLSQTLDSIGPLGNSVACCALVDAVLAGEVPQLAPPFDIRMAVFGVPQTLVLDALDEQVAAAFADVRHRLVDAGARLVDLPLPEFAEVAELNRRVGFVAAEAYAWHKDLIAASGDRYDPRVLKRILLGRDVTVAHLDELTRLRAGLIERTRIASASVHALLLPTIPIVAPAIAPLIADEARFFEANGRALRNASIVNFLDACALSLPCTDAGTAPVGLMVMGQHGQDAAILRLGAAVEAALRATAC